MSSAHNEGGDVIFQNWVIPQQMDRNRTRAEDGVKTEGAVAAQSRDGSFCPGYCPRPLPGQGEGVGEGLCVQRAGLEP